MKSLQIIKFISLKSILIFSYVYIFVILLSSIFPNYNEKEYEKYSIAKLLYEIIVETILLLLIFISAKCVTNMIVKNIIHYDTIYMNYVSFGLIISIMFITFNKSYREKLILFHNKIKKLL